jgi:cell wall assembly regulator SMI1
MTQTEKLLRDISKYVLLLNEIETTDAQKQAQWLGYAPATEGAILATEKRLNASLPDDYKAFLRITNGFPQTSHAIHATISPVEDIDYLINVDDDLVEVWEEGDKEWDDVGERKIGQTLRRSIIIGGVEDSQKLLLIPPQKVGGKWTYWLFAHWIPGERAFKSLSGYLKDTHNFFRKKAKGLTAPKPVEVIDYSLRTAVFALDWQAVYEKTTQFIVQKVNYHYWNTVADLYALANLSAHKLDKQTDFLTFLDTVPQFLPDARERNDYLMEKYKTIARFEMPFFTDLQNLHRFKPQKEPRGLAEIEKLIENNRKDLLKEKNAAAKVNYQLHFLFDFGNTEGYLKLFENQANGIGYFPEYLRAAAVYAHIDNKQKAAWCIQQYQNLAIDFRPFDPYLNESLLPILEWQATQS